MGQDLGHGEDHVRGAPILAQLAVHVGAESQLLWINLGFDPRSERQKPIGRLRANPLQVRGLHVAGGEIEGARVPEDMAQRPILGHVAHPPPDHDRQLPLVVKEPRECRVRDLRPGSGEGIGGLEKQAGLAGEVVTHLPDVASVVAPHAYDLRRRSRREQANLIEPVNAPGGRSARAAHRANRTLVEDSPGTPSEPYDPHSLSRTTISSSPGPVPISVTGIPIASSTNRTNPRAAAGRPS